MKILRWLSFLQLDEGFWLFTVAFQGLLLLVPPLVPTLTSPLLCAACCCCRPMLGTTIKTKSSSGAITMLSILHALVGSSSSSPCVMTGFDLLADKILAVHRAIYPGIGDHTDTTINKCDSDGDGNNDWTNRHNNQQMRHRRRRRRRRRLRRQRQRRWRQRRKQ